ncbi:MAG: peptidase [Microbacteriaceae bacterium]|nr:peptidase [Microbacteriaceae bacterium]
MLGGVATLVVVAGCTTASTMTTTVANTAAAEPPAVGVSGAFTPLTASIITAPTPLRTSDGKTHLAVELQVTNTAPRAATLTRVTLTDAASPSTVLVDLQGAALRDTTVLAGDLALTRTTVIPAFATALVVIDAIAPTGSQPSALQPHLSADFAPPEPGQPPYVSIFPNRITENLPAFAVKTDPVLNIGAPLGGGTWLTINACCSISAHRGAVLGRDGTLVAPERYAIDFSRIGDNGDLYAGSSHTLQSDLSYGAELLAVANGTVVSVSDALPDQPMGVNPTGFSLVQLTGNEIVLKLSTGVYALYAHNEPGSLRVKVGQKVTKGQVLALLGNSGNSTAPHLHFQLMAGPEALNSDGLPFTWDRYTLYGAIDSSGVPRLLDTPQSERNSYALGISAVRFPGKNTGAAVVGSGDPTTLPQDPALGTEGVGG